MNLAPDMQLIVFLLTLALFVAGLAFVLALSACYSIGKLERKETPGDREKIVVPRALFKAFMVEHLAIEQAAGFLDNIRYGVWPNTPTTADVEVVTIVMKAHTTAKDLQQPYAMLEAAAATCK